MIRDHESTGSGEWALRGRFVATPDGIRAAAIIIRDEKIVAVNAFDDVRSGCSIVDAGDRLVLPGLVETHAHINEPGRTDWEGFATATQAAAAGGITTLIDMPLNSSPVTTTVAALQSKRHAAVGQCSVDVGFHAGIVPGNSDQIEALIAEGVCAFKVFLCHSGIDDFPNATEADLRAAMPKLAKAGVPLLAHAELVAPLPKEVEENFAAHPTSYQAWLAMRPSEWEVRAIRLLIDLCRGYRCPVHIVHLSASLEARSLIAAAKAEGLPLTVETCPHYLYFAAEEIPDAQPLFKCAPPIRDAQHRSVLREMVQRGEIDTIGSDHSPAPPDLKHLDTGNLRLAWGGISSLQLMLPIINTVFGSLDDVYDRLTSNPAKLAGLTSRKGAIAVGLDADLVVFDPHREFVVDQEKLHHRHKGTPYNGRRLRGVVEATYLRGRLIYDNGQLTEEGAGRLLEAATSRTPPTFP